MSFKFIIMKSQLKEIIKKINPELFGVKEINFASFKKLGVGEGNLNYVFKLGNKKFICRVNIDKEMPNKSKDEFDNLKKIQYLGISPKPIYLHDKNPKFIILDFIKGHPFRMGKRTFTDSQVKNIAKILASLHNQKINSMKKREYTYSHYFEESQEYFKQINKYTKNKFSDILSILDSQIMSQISKKETHEFGLIHGDLCPQNLVETDNEIKLIDWESVKYSDPAKDIANILIDFELNKQQLDLFLREYSKLRFDKTILNRAKTFAILLRYVYVLWEITRTFEIINKELPKEYLQKTTAKSHLNEAKKQFNKLKKLVEISNLNIDSLFTGAKI